MKQRLETVFLDLCKTVAVLLLAYGISSVLMELVGEHGNAELVYVLAVVVVSSCTNGYGYGIAASIISAFCVNYFFMYPYEQFTLLLQGYPIAFASMLVIAAIVCTLTSRTKMQAREAREREKQTLELSRQNQRLSQEKAMAYVEAEKEKMRGNLLRAISHDLRTPLTGILGASSVIMEHGGTADRKELQRLAADMKEDAEWLINMVENLLSVTRMVQSGQAVLELKPEAVEEVMADAVLKIRKRFPEAGIKVQAPYDLLMVHMDPLLIKQVLINLLENAIRHSEDSLHISLTAQQCRREGDGLEYAVFQVSDQGTGLDDAVRDAVRLGMPLSPEEGGDSTRGSGIGLSACQSIIKAHHGFFEAENRTEGGAVFRFGLPMTEEDMIYESETDHTAD